LLGVTTATELLPPLPPAEALAPAGLGLLERTLVTDVDAAAACTVFADVTAGWLEVGAG
jgi:hypothetical protein